MMVRSGHPVAQPWTLACAVLLMLLFPAGSVWSQSGAPTAPPALGLQDQGTQASPPPVPAATAPPAREENPGLVNEMGKLFDKLPSILPPLKSPSETIDDLNARAKDTFKDTLKGTGEALSRLATPSTMATGRIICPASPNGAPDCKQAADKLCQGKGYKEGKSLNADSTESCSAKVLIPGRQRKPGDCRTDTFVTSALCQN
jgi:hypothetical protein